MAINEIQLGAAAGDGNGDGLREGGEIINSNFTTPENAASKIVQASSADTTSDKVMLSHYAWRGAQLGDYFTYGGTANAITLTSANLASAGTLIAGMKFRFKATASNTGATTITVDGGSTISCVTPTGVALPADFIRTDVITECEYDGANFVVSRKVESGINANGEWTRWEDGTQVTIQSIQQNGISINTAAVNIFRSAYFSGLTFPKSFSAQPNCSFSVSDSNSYVWVGIGGTASSSSVSSNYVVFAPNSIISEDVKITATATGKWY